MVVTVLLADDEPVIIRGLKKLLRWESLGVELVGEALNGNQAEQLILQKNPDILISDICMPGKTGIELLKTIKNHNLNTKVIFLSGFQEFSYVKDAMAFGALNYLLKPVDKAQLEQTVQKAISMIDKEVEEAQIRNKLSSYENERKNIFKESLLEQLVDGNITLQDRSADFSFYGINIKYGYFSVLGIEIDDLPGKDHPLAPQEVQLIKYSVSNLIEEILNLRGIGNVFHKDNLIVVILNHEAYETSTEQALTTASRIKEVVKMNLHKTVTIGVGETVAGIGQISKTYQSAKKALDYKFFRGNDNVIVIVEDHIVKHKAEDLYHEQKKLMESLLVNEKEICEGCFLKIKDMIWDITYGKKESAISYFLSMINNISRELADIGIDLDAINQKENDEISKVGNFIELGIWVANYIQGVSELISVGIKSKETLDIKKVKDYIENNYQQNITLEVAASIACMNPNYFSTFFKKQTGENFKDFLLGVRMEKAIRILLTTDCKTYEIAEQVGFNDAKHFSDMFKKYYGKNPMEYKRR